jgi:hypothetical protein
MGYQGATSLKYTRAVDLTLAASAARTATGNGTTTDSEGASVANLTLDVTVRSGTTPTLDVTIQTSADGTAWRTAGTFTQATAVTSERKSFNLDRYVRAAWTIGGTTPSFTFSVIGEGV